MVDVLKIAEKPDEKLPLCKSNTSRHLIYLHGNHKLNYFSVLTYICNFGLQNHGRNYLSVMEEYEYL